MSSSRPFTSHKLVFLLSFSTLFLTFSSAAVNRECLADWRDPSYQCPTQANIVCAYFTGENCDSDLCQKVSLNPCTACQDTSVTHFTDGTCDFTQIFCDDNSRSAFPEQCDLDGNVCGYYREGCPVEICAVDMGSSCAACHDPKILYYKLGFCNIHDAVVQCEADTSCSGAYPARSDFYNPVCAFRENCVGPTCARNFDNECAACTTPGYTQFKRGLCDQGTTECANIDRPLVCTSVPENPVCAYFAVPGASDQIIGRAPADNSCSACLDTTVKYFTDGACSAVDRKTYCLPYQRPDSCPDSDEPVCGFAVDSTGLFYAYKNMASSCEACQDPNVVYHEPGACSFQCRGDEADEEGACSGSIVEPVCVRYTNNRGRAAFMSVKNKCVACNDVDLDVTSFTEGLCSGANRALQCADDPASFYYGDIYPVCGYLQENCRRASCRMTFSEPIVACSYPAVSYLPGVCPGDQGISCEVYRTKRGICDGKEDFTQRVCGYTRANCRNNSCRRSYQNQCYACENASVIFFEKGNCGSQD